MAQFNHRRLAAVPELSLNKFTEGREEEKKQFIDDLFEGLKYFGFIILKDHPISINLLKQSYDLSQKLFALSESTKAQYISDKGGGQRGYTPFGTEHAKYTDVPDLKEFWHVGREISKDHEFANQYPENIWPNELKDFESTFKKMYSELERVGDIILSALAPSLKVSNSYFEQMTKDGNSILRLLHYPPIPEGADPRSIRAAAHEDINLITILVSASASGLELLDRDGKWLSIETDPNNLIVDAGDMLARITNDVIPATTHRVVNPADGNFSRYSMPFFIHPNPKAVLSCIPSCRGEGEKYADISAQEFLMERLREIGLT